ncbi:MAG: CHAT domain-containing protein, partial [Phaeodactylibacter sp.]|nr:CHAT domain-containing protein [Phaeodactylibacter sp.]
QYYPNSSLLLREQATKSQLRAAIQAGVGLLQLSTHTEINNDYPTESIIYLTPDSLASDQLFLKEVFELLEGHQLQFVILESCDSGAGLVPSGQGIAGFAYELSLVGVPSLVYSLWPLPEGPSNAIIMRMHLYLLEGYSKPAALRQAKLDFLAETEAHRTTPFLWAGMVFTGQTGPLYAGRTVGTGTGWNWLWALLPIVVFLLLLIRNRGKKAA